MSALASAADEMAMKIAAESLARGAERMGDSERKGLGYVADTVDGAALLNAYKEARNAVRHQADVEKAVVMSSSVLFTKPADGEQKLKGFESLIAQRAAALQNEVTAFYKLRAEQLKVAAAEPEWTAAEKEAAQTLVERVGGGGRGPGGGGGGRGAGNANLSPSDQAALRKVPQHMTAELNILLGQKKTVMQIRDFLSGEFEPLPLADLMGYLRVQEKNGAVKLIRQ
jgi:aminopeptidase YwaD